MFYQKQFKFQTNIIATEYLQKNGNKAKRKRDNKWLGCKRCINFKKDDWHIGSLINYINFSMYPAPCQGKCIYCTASTQWKNTPDVKQAYEKLFKVIELADKKGLISPDALWQVSSGEAALHPYKDRIISMVENKKATFYTNGFICDEDIARVLGKNKNARINISVDSGTPQTWAKVKGFDNFKEVVKNLVSYRKASLGPGQIELKYIVLPGINDSDDDFEGIIELMNKLDVVHLTVTRDSVVKYSSSKRENFELMKSVARLTWLGIKKGKTIGLLPYSDWERRKVRMIIRWNRLKGIFKRKK